MHFDCVNGFLNFIKEIILQTEAICCCPLKLLYSVVGLYNIFMGLFKKFLKAHIGHSYFPGKYM